MYVSISTTIVGEWLNSLIFHDDSKYVTANELTITCAGSNNKIWHMKIIYFAQKFLKAVIHYYYICINGFRQLDIIKYTST